MNEDYPGVSRRTQPSSPLDRTCTAPRHQNSLDSELEIRLVLRLPLERIYQEDLSKPDLSAQIIISTSCPHFRL